jgi:hypothetical protein
MKLTHTSKAMFDNTFSHSNSTYSTRSNGPRNPLDKVAQTFKKMEGKAWKSSATTFSGLSYTISRDNTSGECARQAKLFAEFGRRRSSAFASSFGQHYEGADNKMCEYTKDYFVYTSCVDPGAHFFGSSVDKEREHQCPQCPIGPHERYIVIPGHCPLCSP